MLCRSVPGVRIARLPNLKSHALAIWAQYPGGRLTALMIGVSNVGDCVDGMLVCSKFSSSFFRTGMRSSSNLNSSICK